MSIFKKSDIQAKPSAKPAEVADPRPLVDRVVPQAALPGGEVVLHGKNLAVNGTAPTVRIGGLSTSLLFTSPRRLVVRVPTGIKKGEIVVESEKGAGAPVALTVGGLIAEMLHPVANPAVNAEGVICSTLSGSRGQKTPVSVFQINLQRVMVPLVKDLLNPTGLAFDRAGDLYVSSRAEGTIYRIAVNGQRSVYAEGMGVATGIAFDENENLYAGDRTGTIFKINRERQIFVFATLEPSVSAYHLAFGPDGRLYVTGPTTSSYDHVYRVDPSGHVETFYRGLGRPQGLAFDAEGRLYVAASIAGQRGIVRLAPKAEPELFVSGNNVVGLAFTPQKTLVAATHDSLYELSLGIVAKRLP